MSVSCQERCLLEGYVFWRSSKNFIIDINNFSFKFYTGSSILHENSIAMCVSVTWAISVWEHVLCISAEASWFTPRYKKSMGHTSKNKPSFPIMLTQWRNRQKRQFLSLWSAAGNYKYLGRCIPAELPYIQKKKLWNPNALITMHESNYMWQLLEGGVYLVVFIG